MFKNLSEIQKDKTSVSEHVNLVLKQLFNTKIDIIGIEVNSKKGFLAKL